jgi:hypothetical protein
MSKPAAGIEKGEHLSSRFDASSRVAIFGPGESRQMEPMRQVEIVTNDNVMTMRSQGDDPQLALRVSRRTFARGPFLVRLDVTTQTETVVQLFWKTPRVPLFCEEQSVRTHLTRGRNIRYVRIPARTVVGRIRFDPAACFGELRLHSLEIRQELPPVTS